ncbi:MAG TPA: TauD/TfdA family dioxygenase [Labilithrix sp.]|nr:TauD/TfdA family dioxygenase [Labilithrix sp.]
MEVIPARSGGFGAEIRGVDVRSVDSRTADAIKAAVHEHALVFFREQQPTVQEYLQFGNKLGTPMIYPDERYHHPEYPEIFVSSNVKDRKVGMARSGYFWHTDLSFKPKPQALTVLYPQVLPKSRRETLYLDMAEIYSELPAKLRAVVENRTARHDPALRYKVEHTDVEARLDLGEILAAVRLKYPAPDHPCVIVHPVSKKRILYMNEGFTTAINGLPYEESQAALAELFEFIKRPAHVKTYGWHEGDIVVWDNRTLLHRSGAIPPGEQSMMFRIGIDDLVPFYDGIKV